MAYIVDGSNNTAIGYNVSKANELMKEIKKAYDDLGLYASQEWDPVVKELQENWVGEDEQDFEEVLAQRICTLYMNACQLANNCILTIKGLAEAWHTFQTKNNLSGSVSETMGSFRLADVTINSKDDIVSRKKKKFDDKDFRGLTSSNSATRIQSSVEGFVNGIKKRTEDLFQSIDVGKAFFGSQTSTIKAYVEKTGIAIAQVTVSLKDLHEKLSELASTNYSKVMTDVEGQLNTAAGEVEKSASETPGAWV